MTNNYPKYDPTDIESLLQNKAFDELNSSEREFALQHVGSPEEYSSMRDFLLNIRTSFQKEEEIEPATEIRNNLLEQFNKVHNSNKKRSVWNGLMETLFPSGKSIFLSPGFQLAALAVLIFGIGIVFFNQGTNTDHSMAIVTEKEKDGNAISQPELPASPVEETAIKTDDEINTGESAEPKPLTDKFVTTTISPEATLSEAKSEYIMDGNFSMTRNDTIRSSNTGGALARQERNKNEGEVAMGATSTFSSSEVANDYELDKVELKETAVTKTASEKSKKSENQQQKKDMAYKDITTADLEKAPGKESPGVSAAERSELMELLFTSL